MRTNAAQIAQRNRKRARAFVRYHREALHESEGSIHWTAQGLSLGDTPTETLSAPPPGLNNPYGYGRYNRRGPRGPIPNGGNAAIINKQTGTFATSWDANGFFTPQRMIIVLWNSAPYSAAMLGTDRMIHRPIIEAIHRIEDPRFFQRFREAQRRAYSI